MAGLKVSKLMLDDHGSYLGMEKGCFVVKDKHGEVERYPLFEKEVGEVVLKSGNSGTSYLHSIQFAKPSLVCDIQEIFRANRGFSSNVSSKLRARGL